MTRRRSVVAQDLVDCDALLGEPRDRPRQESDRGRRGLVLQDLDVEQAHGLFDGGWDRLPSHVPRPAQCPRAEVALARAGEPAQGLDVDVDQLSGTRPRAPVRRFEGSSSDSRFRPTRVRAAQTVATAMPNPPRSSNWSSLAWRGHSITISVFTGVRFGHARGRLDR